LGGSVDTVIYEARDLTELKRTTSSIKVPKRGTWINVTVQTDERCLMINATVPYLVPPEKMDSVYGILEEDINKTLNIRGLEADDAIVATYTHVFTLDGKIEDPEQYKPNYRTDFRQSISKVEASQDKKTLQTFIGILGFTEACKQN
jgi:hypothetical protein